MTLVFGIAARFNSYFRLLGTDCSLDLSTGQILKARPPVGTAHILVVLYRSKKSMPVTIISKGLYKVYLAFL